MSAIVTGTVEDEPLPEPEPWSPPEPELELELELCAIRLTAMIFALTELPAGISTLTRSATRASL
jgi:hypothetical protein